MMPRVGSVAYLVKPEWPKIALLYAMASLANDVRLAPGRLVAPDFAARARYRPCSMARIADCSA